MDFARPLFKMSRTTPRYVHLLAEIEKRVFADRAEYLGDTDFVDVPVGRLLDPQYLMRQATALKPAAISDAGEYRPEDWSHTRPPISPFWTRRAMRSP